MLYFNILSFWNQSFWIFIDFNVTLSHLLPSISFSQPPQKERRPSFREHGSLWSGPKLSSHSHLPTHLSQANHSSMSLFILLLPRFYLAESFSFLKMHIRSNLFTMFSVSSLSRIVTFYMLLISSDTISSCFTFYLYMTLSY